MQNQEWIRTLEDGRMVKFIYQRVREGGAFITARIAANEVIYSVLLAKAVSPSNRKDVESHFSNEVSKKSRILPKSTYFAASTILCTA
jgi:hypothetical protein